MAGQIGIKTNLSIDRTKLDAEIKRIQKTLESQDALKIKLSVNQDGIKQLEELKTLVKDITSMAGKGIKIKVDHYKMKEADELGSSDNATKEAEKVAKAQEEAIKAREALLEKREKLNDLLNKIEEEGLEQQKVINKKIDDVLRERTDIYKNGYGDQIKITQKLDDEEEVSSVIDVRTVDIKAQEKVVKNLRTELDKTKKAFNDLGKKTGIAMPKEIPQLSKMMKQIEKSFSPKDSGIESIYDVEKIQKVNEVLGQLNEQQKKMALTGSNKLSALDITKTVNKSVASLDTLKKKYENIKDAYPEMDADGKILADLNKVGATLDKIKKSGAGTGKTALSELSIDLDTATRSMNGMKAEVTEIANKDKMIRTLKNSLSGLFQFEKSGAISASSISKFKKEIAELENIKSPETLRRRVDEIADSLNLAKMGAREAAVSMRGLGNESHGIKKLSDGLAKMGIYFSAWRITSEIFQEIKRGIGVVAELDNQIVQVGIDMNVTAEESKSLIQNAQRIASETGIAIDEIVRVAGVYSNATETMDSVLAKVKPSAILAGVAGANASEITDMFQGVVNQYKLAKDDIEATSYQISDSIIAVAKNMSQNFDTSVKEISNVMLDAGAVMKELGYTYQETMAMAGAIMEVTRQSGSELSGAMRMIGARIGGAKNTGEDVDIEEISNAAKAYKAIGIEIVDTEGNFKDMKDTINELSQVWGTLTDVERSYIAEMSAGNRRRNTFMVMMDTMQKQTDLTSEALNSQGATLEANAKYMESTEAKMRNFTNAMDTLWQNTISSEGLKTIIEIGTGFIKVADAIGLVGIALLGFNAYLIASGKSVIILKTLRDTFYSLSYGAVFAQQGIFKYTMSLIAASAKTLFFKAVTIATQAALTMGLSMAITAVVSVLIDLANGYDESAKKAQKFADTIDTTKNSLDEIKKINSKIKINEAMLTGLDPKSEKAVEIKEEIVNLQKQLAKVLPESANAFTDEGEAISNNTEKVDKEILAKEKLIKTNAKLWLQENGVFNESKVEGLKSEGEALSENIKKAQEYEKQGKKTQTIFEKEKVGNFGVANIEIDNMAELNRLLQEREEYNAMAIEHNQMIDDTGDESLQHLKLELITYDSIEKKVSNLITGTKTLENGFGGVVRTTQELDKSLKDSVDIMNDFESILDELKDKDFDGISEESLKVIIDQYPQLLQYIDDEKKLKEEILKLYDVEQQKSKDTLAVKLATMTQDSTNYFKTMNSKIQNDEEWYRVNVLNNKELITTFANLYKIDLTNFNTLQQAKTEADRGYIRNATNNYNSFFNRLSNAYGQMAREADALADKVNKARFTIGGRTIETDYDGGTGWRKQFTGMSTYTQGLNAISWSGVNPSKGTGSGSGSAGSKDKDNVIESDEVFFNKHIALIEEYQRQLDILERKISKTQENIAYYRQIGSDSALQNALNLQNRLYEEQAQKVTLLTQAQSGLKREQNLIASSMSSKGIDMSKQTNEDLNYWLDVLYPKVSSTNQKTIDAQNEKREAFKVSWEAYMSYASELINIESELLGLQTELLETLKEKYDIEFEIIENRLEKIAKVTEDINKELALLDDSSSYNKRESLTSSALNSLIDYKTELESTLRTLTQQRNGLEINSAEWVIINDQVKEYENALHDTNVEILQTQNNLKALRDEEFNNSMSLLDKIATGVRKQYEEAKKAELAALKASLDAEVGNKRKELEILQDRLDALNDTTADKEAELKALRAEAKMWEEDDSVFAKARLAELEKLIKEKERELEKDLIQNEMDNLEEEIDAIEEANQEKVDGVNETYEELLADQNVYQQASRILMTSSQDEILAFLLQYDEKYKSMGSVLGAAFATGLMEEIAKGLDSFEALSDGLLGSENIPWLSTLPSGYSYDASGGVKANAIGASSVSSLSSDASFDSIDYATMRKMIDYKSLATQIENANVEMNVNFYTNGQLDVDRSIKSLGDMLKGSLAGSGTMLNINK